jgi:hypothetical protein
MTDICLFKKQFSYQNNTFDVLRKELTIYYKMGSDIPDDTILVPEEIEGLLFQLSKEQNLPNLIHIANQYGAIHIWNLDHIQKIKAQMENYLKQTVEGEIKLLNLEIENWDLDKNSPDEIILNNENFIKWLNEFINLCNRALSERRNMMLIGD